jgi:hypothetical protein
MTIPPRPNRHEPRLFVGLPNQDDAIPATADGGLAPPAPERVRVPARGSFVGSETCEKCVKFFRAATALLLDAAIAAFAIFVVRWLGVLITAELGEKAAEYEPLIDPIHRGIVVVTLVTYAAWGIWDGIQGVRKSTSPPCRECE